MKIVIKADVNDFDNKTALEISNEDLNNINFVDLYIKGVLDCTVSVEDIYQAIEPFYTRMIGERNLQVYEEHCFQQRDEIYKLKNLLKEKENGKD